MVPEVNCEVKREAARDAMKSSAMQTVSSIVHETVILLGLAVLSHGERR